MQNLLATFIEDCQQSTLWIGHTGEEAIPYGIAALAIRETEKEVFIEVRLPDVDRQTLYHFSLTAIEVFDKWY